MEACLHSFLMHSAIAVCRPTFVIVGLLNEGFDFGVLVRMLCTFQSIIIGSLSSVSNALSPYCGRNEVTIFAFTFVSSEFAIASSWPLTFLKYHDPSLRDEAWF